MSFTYLVLAPLHLPSLNSSMWAEVPFLVACCICRRCSERKQMCRGLTNARWEFRSVYGPNENWFLAFSARVKDCCTFSCKIKATKQLWLHHMLYIPGTVSIYIKSLALSPPSSLPAPKPCPHTPTQCRMQIGSSPDKLPCSGQSKYWKEFTLLLRKRWLEATGLTAKHRSQK